MTSQPIVGTVTYDPVTGRLVGTFEVIVEPHPPVDPPLPPPVDPPPVDPPPAPRNVAAAADGRVVILSWDPVPLATAYLVRERGTSAVLATVTPPMVSRRSGVLRDGSYVYSVAAVVDGRESAATEAPPVMVPATPVAPPTPPGPVTPVVPIYVKSRGPNGTHWPPHTPPPWAPATRLIPTLRELPAALAACRSGDVVGVTDPFTGGGGDKTVLSGGSTDWGGNVLVRAEGPPQHVSADFTLRLKHVTLSNFIVGDESDYTAPGELSLGVSDRSFLTRILWCSNDQLLLSSTRDCGVYELVVPRRYALGGDDTFRIGGSGGDGWVGSQNLHLVGIHAVGKWRPDGNTGHCDVAQTYSPNAPAVGTTWVDFVLGTAADKVWQGEDSHVIGQRWINGWMNSGAHRDEEPPPGMNMSPYGQAVSAPGRDFLFEEVDVLGAINHKSSTTANTGTFRKVRCRGGTATRMNTPTIVEMTTGDSVNIRNIPMPPLPDLAKIWGRE